VYAGDLKTGDLLLGNSQDVSFISVETQFLIEPAISVNLTVGAKP
jgi:hypothetical protein